MRQSDAPLPGHGLYNAPALQKCVQESAGPIWYIFPPIGGPGIGPYWRAFELSKVWSSAGFETLIIGPGNHHYASDSRRLDGFKTVESVKYFFVRSGINGNTKFRRLLSSLMFSLILVSDRQLRILGATRPPKVIIYSSPYPFAYLAAHWLSFRFRSRLIFEVRDLWPLSLTEVLKLPWFNPVVLFSWVCERFAYKTACHVVSLLENSHEYMISRGLPPARFTYIPNGVSICDEISETFGAAPPPLSRAQQLRSEGKFLVVHAGNMSITTDLNPLLRAMQIIAEWGRDDIIVLLIGKGDETETLRFSAAKAGLQNVEFFGPVSKQAISQLLRTVDVGYAALSDLPIYNFGYSLNKLFDYMSVALPIIFACNSPGFFDRSRAGLRVKAGCPESIASAITLLADTPLSVRKAMGENGRAFVQDQHNYVTLGNKYISVLNDAGR